MDKQTARLLEEGLKKHGKLSEKISPTLDTPLYLQDLEKRARERNTTLDAIYEHDMQLLAQAHPTSDCLRPDEVMQCVENEEDLSHRAWEHYHKCHYCSCLVASAQPERNRLRELADKMATLQEECYSVASASTIITRSDAIFKKIDRSIPAAFKGGLVAASLVLVFFVSPDWVREKAPIWTWKDSQLVRSTLALSKIGYTDRAETLATELIRREPTNPNWYLIRSKARVQGGKEKLAEADFRMGNKLLNVTGTSVSASWLVTGKDAGGQETIEK